MTTSTGQVLHDNEISKPQTESFYREMLNNHEDEIVEIALTLRDVSIPM
jgi:hypothetical protein